MNDIAQDGVPSTPENEGRGMYPQDSRRMTAIEFLRVYNNVICKRSKVS